MKYNVHRTKTVLRLRKPYLTTYCTKKSLNIADRTSLGLGMPKNEHRLDAGNFIYILIEVNHIYSSFEI